MKFKYLKHFILLLLVFNCNKEKIANKQLEKSVEEKSTKIIPEKNKKIVDLVKKFGPEISPTYEKAVCTELVIQILEKSINLNETDKKRIRIITQENIQKLLNENSDIPKGVYFALNEKGIGIPINNHEDVIEGDFVQFWTETWGHCGIVKRIDSKKNEMELYSSFPSTNGYGIQNFNIPKYAFFIRLK